MKKLIFISVGMLLVSGCVPLIIGAGVLTGYALSGDSASGEVDSDYRTLWDLCIRTLEEMEAEVTDSNESKGLIRARLSNHDVTVSINTLSPKVQNLKIAARKHLLPKPHFAQKIFLEVMQSL